MDIIVLIGRILFVFVFLTSGYAHFAKRNMMAPLAASKGVPAPMAATLAGGVLLLAGGVSVLLGIWADLGSLLLASRRAGVARSHATPGGSSHRPAKIGS